MKALFLCVTVVACVPPATQPSYYGPNGQPQAGPQQPQASAGGSGCMQLMSCFHTCQDAACYQACLGQSDPQSQAAANVVATCIAGRCENGGEDCVATQCQSEIEACNAGPAVAQATPQQPTYDQPTEQMMPGQPHTTANILPWMVGNWEGNNFHYTFYPDGRVLRASGVALYTPKGDYACASIVNETGTVTQEGDLLIMRFAAANENHCGDKSSAPALTVRNRIVWYQYNGPVELKLVDIDCTRGAMYCSDPMTRR